MSSNTKDLLIELGTEELPPKILNKLMIDFKLGISQNLTEAKINFDTIKAYATPRRLAVVVQDVDINQKDQIIQRRGPAIQAAFDKNGNTTKALRSFAKSCHITINSLEEVRTKKGAWIVFSQKKRGACTINLISGILHQTLRDLPIPRNMRWGNIIGGFARPIHWIISLFGDEVIPIKLLGVKSGRKSYGHRSHHPKSIYIQSAKTYAQQLEVEGYVVADMEARRHLIRKQILKLATNLGGEAIINEDLLDEITGMVEWPIALSGSYDERFLKLPDAVLISSKERHQKCFAVRDKLGNLLPHFITICNLESRDPAQVIEGNERVMLARLSDASFFWHADREKPLADRQEQLKTIVFQNRLGTLHDKSARVAKLSVEIARKIGGNTALAERTALLAKCDLVTDIVGEFPNLQGIMGKYHAHLDGEHDEIAEALHEQYLPLFAGDKLPQTKSGQAVSLAEKFDTLVGLFGIGQPPTGVKDPFALRRASLGILRIIIENGLNVDLANMLEQAHQGFNNILGKFDVTSQVMCYFYERLRIYSTNQGVTADIFEAVLAVKPTKPIDFMKRLEAVHAFLKLSQAKDLVVSNKRINNILHRNNNAREKMAINDSLLKEKAEKDLANKLDDISFIVQPLIANSNYKGALIVLSDMHETVDNFFNKVMIMVDDEAIRTNRFTLLHQTRNLLLSVADISYLQK
ncbi:MAG: glycine--tRNA ligase subunit beta [Piscirickettsiaceae bacterium]|nr:glycine--tRNA ligase subunit beta [Piscirickettsiaceae bacterium]